MSFTQRKRASFCCILAMFFAFAAATPAKEKIHALYIPLADHYAAAVVAHAKYRQEMQECDYSVEMMKSWPSLRGKFEAGQADVAFIISPMAMDMFAKKQNFRFVSLVHRDGNALAVNEILEKKLNLPESRLDRKPTADVAEAMGAWKKENGAPSICAVPSLLATHTVVLYKYLRDHGKTLAIGRGDGDVLAKAVAPPKSPDFLKLQAKSGRAASFEQSLPWADIVETGGFGKVAWYSKDVIEWENGHVECIMIATDNAIKNKKEALKELIEYIHKAGKDIDDARTEGGRALRDIAVQVNKYIPGHNIEAVEQSLRADLAVINYSNMNVDKPGIRLIMDLAVEGGILKKKIDIDAFADEGFSVHPPETAPSDNQ